MNGSFGRKSARSKVQDAIAALGLALLPPVLIWSGGVIFAGTDQQYERADTIERVELRPLRWEIDAGRHMENDIDTLRARAERRGDSVGRFLPDSTPPPSLSSAVYDSISAKALQARAAAADDSVEIAALRMLPLAPIDRELITVADRALAAERRELLRWSLLARHRAQGREPLTVRDSFLIAQEEHRIALRGLAMAFQRSEIIERDLERRYDEVYRRWQRAADRARRHLVLAWLMFPFAGVALATAVHFVRTGELDVARALGLRT